MDKKSQIAIDNIKIELTDLPPAPSKGGGVRRSADIHLNTPSFGGGWGEVRQLREL